MRRAIGRVDTTRVGSRGHLGLRTGEYTPDHGETISEYDNSKIIGLIKKAMKNEDKGDMDKDGKDEPDSEEYMDNKDKAIKKAMKKETKEAPGEMDNNDDEEVKLSHGSQYDEGKKPKFHSLKDIVNSIIPISSIGLSKKNR